VEGFPACPMFRSQTKRDSSLSSTCDPSLNWKSCCCCIASPIARGRLPASVPKRQGFAVVSPRRSMRMVGPPSDERHCYVCDAASDRHSLRRPGTKPKLQSGWEYRVRRCAKNSPVLGCTPARIPSDLQRCSVIKDPQPLNIGGHKRSWVKQAVKPGRIGGPIEYEKLVSLDRRNVRDVDPEI